MSQKIANHEVLTRYRDALLARFPDQLQRLILFGSQARGDATAGSDIDVLVVVNWEEERLPGGFYAVKMIHIDVHNNHVRQQFVDQLHHA